MPSGRGPRRLGPELGQQNPPGPVRLQDHDLLLEDRRHQRLHQPSGPAQPEPRITAGRVPNQRMGSKNQTPSHRHKAPKTAGSASSSHPAPGPQAHDRTRVDAVAAEVEAGVLEGQPTVVAAEPSVAGVKPVEVGVVEGQPTVVAAEPDVLGAGWVDVLAEVEPAEVGVP